MQAGHASASLRQDLVLLGGGHAHLAVLRHFAMRPEPGLRITLINRGSQTPYSGMLPAHVAGFYDHAQTHFDLRALAAAAGAGFIDAEAAGLDADAGLVLLPGRCPVHWDRLSVNIGATPGVADVPGAAAHAMPVKPVNGFLARWHELEATLLARRKAGRAGANIVVVGAGAGGVELALALSARLRQGLLANTQLHLVGADPQLLPGLPGRAGAIAGQWLRERGVRTHSGQRVSRVGADAVSLEDGTRIDCDAALWVTQAAPAPWLTDSGLALDERGFIAVDEHLESISHPGVFAAGDIAGMRGQPRPKSGVFAVRQGPVLARNLRSSLQGRPLRRYRAQKRALVLIGSGDGRAIAVRGSTALQGRWAWRLKDFIDRRFMHRYQSLAPRMAKRMAREAEAAGAEPRHCAGCGAKVGAAVLREVLAQVHTVIRPDVISGLEQADDAAILEVPPGWQLVHSVDVFPAICDDLWLLGGIAVNHCLSDIYAMGARGQSALAVVTLPRASSALQARMLHELLGGAAARLAEDGVVLTGGHTSEGPELQIGFAVTGLLDPDAPQRYAGASGGDVLVLTRALGTGVLFAAAMAGAARPEWMDTALAAMAQSNRPAAAVLEAFDVHACTDVSGFGLLGHLPTVVDAANWQVLIDPDAVPALAGARELLREGWRSTLFPGNLEALAPPLRAMVAQAHPLLSDPQTAGGLLLALPKAEAADCLAALARAGSAAVVIGRVEPGSGVRLGQTTGAGGV